MLVERKKKSQYPLSLCDVVCRQNEQRKYPRVNEHLGMTSTSNSNTINHVHGYVAQGWERIRTAFEQNFIDQLDVGASLCIYHRGTCVVDLCGGWKDTETKTEPYTSDTLQLVFSTSKGVMAAAIALCVERGWLQYHHSVARYWPEFAANGKQVSR